MIEDKVRSMIREHIHLATDHPIYDDFPLYSLGFSRRAEVAVVFELARVFEVDPFELAGKALVGTNLASHTVPHLVSCINEVL